MPNRYKSTIKIMLSSRCSDQVSLDGEMQSLTAVRARIRDRLQADFCSLSGKALFKVFMNEENPPAGAHETFWKECLEVVDQSDMVIVLFNGEAGYARAKDAVGICHAEFAHAVARGASRTRGMP